MLYRIVHPVEPIKPDESWQVIANNLKKHHRALRYANIMSAIALNLVLWAIIIAIYAYLKHKGIVQ
jgi:hypothetical protein